MAKFEIYQDARGEFRWRLIAPNGRTIADSGEGYATRQACEDGIASVKRYAPDATIVTRS
jgi:hypothetical protein